MQKADPGALRTYLYRIWFCIFVHLSIRPSKELHTIASGLLQWGQTKCLQASFDTNSQSWTLFGWDLKWSISARYLTPWRSCSAATRWPVGRTGMKTSRWDEDVAKRWLASAARRRKRRRRVRRGGLWRCGWTEALRISVSAGQWRQRLKHNTVVIWTVLPVCQSVSRDQCVLSCLISIGAWEDVRHSKGQTVTWLSYIWLFCVRTDKTHTHSIKVYSIITQLTTRWLQRGCDGRVPLKKSCSTTYSLRAKNK